jgi:hypothetical protein
MVRRYCVDVLPYVHALVKFFIDTYQAHDYLPAKINTTLMVKILA